MENAIKVDEVACSVGMQWPNAVVLCALCAAVTGCAWAFAWMMTR